MKRKLLLLFIMLSLGYVGWGQVAGDYRSKATGNWNVTTIWESYNGDTWSDAISTPGASNNVYIQSGHMVTLTQNEACNDLHICTGTISATDGDEGVVALSSNILEINGKIRCYYAKIDTIPGISTTTVHNGIITITASSEGKIKFVGNTRNITNNGEWASITTGSLTTYAVEIAMGSNQTATLGTAMKASSWNITSGILDAATYSISADNGTIGAGNIMIETGATIISNISGSSNNVFQRTNNSKAGTLTVNGTLKLNGTSPNISMNAIVFDGTVEYAKGGYQTLAIASNSGASPGNYTNLVLSGSGNKTLGVNTTVKNTLTSVSGTTLTIPASFSLTLSSSCQATLSGTLTNNGTLTLQSPGDNGAPGSLITNGTVSGNVIAERYIGAYTTATDGWHLVSSPVNGAVIGNFSPGDYDDFYKYSESENLWKNWKASNFDFTDGEGYLCSYQSAATKSFTGVPNNADVSFSDMSLTSTRGWHLLGNPFPCAIKWNDGNWTLININTTAKVLNSGGSYTDITANGIIPAMQGFFVEVTNSTNSITIPKAARVHDATAWYKDTQANKLVLTAQSDNNNTYTETVVRFDPEATTGFDEMFDSHFLSGIYGAPQFYSIVGNEKLSSNVFPVSGEVSTIPLGFVKGNADSYTLSASGIETFTNGQSVILEDLKTGIQQKLNDNPVYSFASATGDDANRFQLKFGAASGINEPSASPFSIYVSNGIVYVNNSDNQTLKGTVTVYSVTGQAITTRSLSGDRLQKFSFNSKPGCYIVRVTTDKGVYSQKIIL